MTENEAKERCDLLINSLSVNTGVESAFRNDSTGYMNFTTMREFAQTCKKALEEVDRWHTSIVNPRIKNVFANHSTQICQNCDHKDEYIEELEAEIEQYQKIGTPEECKTAMELYNEMLKRKFTIETVEEYMKFEDECLRKNFTFKSLIEAREKQTAKTPILKNGEGVSFVDYADGHGECKVTKWQDWVCPLCGWFVGQRYNRNNHGKIRFHDQRKSNYCNECGQKIDWKGVED